MTYTVLIYFNNQNIDGHEYKIAELKKDMAISDGFLSLKYIEEGTDKERYAIYPLAGIESIITEED
jgi:hypothetical protein